MKKEDFSKAKEFHDKIEKLDREKKDIEGLIFDIENGNRIDINIHGQSGNINNIEIPDLLLILQSKAKEKDSEIAIYDSEISKI